jgi:hypothetical protein
MFRQAANVRSCMRPRQTVRKTSGDAGGRRQHFANDLNDEAEATVRSFGKIQTVGLPGFPTSAGPWDAQPFRWLIWATCATCSVGVSFDTAVKANALLRWQHFGHLPSPALARCAGRIAHIGITLHGVSEFCVTPHMPSMSYPCGTGRTLRHRGATPASGHLGRVHSRHDSGYTQSHEWGSSRNIDTAGNADVPIGNIRRVVLPGMFPSGSAWLSPGLALSCAPAGPHAAG